jgi:glycosyltransferase involved in cell wall biosynthesis
MTETSISTGSAIIREDFDELTRSTIYRTPGSSPRIPDQSDKDFTIFVPCYNEQDNIIASIDVIVTALVELNRPWEIIVIDDASNDDSVSLVKAYMRNHPDYPLILMVRGENRGLAQNYIEAAFLGRGHYYKLVCGDNVENSRDIVSVLSHAGEVDMVLPYHRNIIYNRTCFRRMVSSLFTQLVNAISGYRLNYYNGCGVHLRYNVMRWNSNCLGFDFQADLVVRLLDQGKTYMEIPIVGMERQFGASKAVTARNFISTILFITGLVARRFGKGSRNNTRIPG